MKRLAACCALVLLSMLAPRAHTAEGRVSELMLPTAQEPRISKYLNAAGGESAAANTASPAISKSRQHGAHAQSKTAAVQITRAQTLTLSSRSSLFALYDAGSALLSDRDGDGYHSEFRIRFDADASFGDALVYARLYLRRVGERDWLLYHTTENFWIYGQADDDDYFVTTTLDDGFASAEYDVLIDLYESGYSGIVATLGPFESAALGYLPLEEAGLDAPIELAGYEIGAVRTALLVDADADGHYSTFRISFNPDADFEGTFVYAKVWVRAAGGTWIEEHVTDDFSVDASGEEDIYSFTADWISGYPTAYYDVQIDLYEAASGLLVASAGSERPELAQIPLEDQSLDRRPNPPAAGGGGSTTSREHGGGAFGAGFVLWLGTLLLSRYRKIFSSHA